MTALRKYERICANVTSGITASSMPVASDQYNGSDTRTLMWRQAGSKCASVPTVPLVPSGLQPERLASGRQLPSLASDAAPSDAGTRYMQREAT